MRYQLSVHGWPIGDKLIPVGTVIDADAPDDWSRLARGQVPPINAVPLDQGCYQLMLALYGDSRIPIVGDLVVRAV
jgi:hypothetical protein